MRLVAVTGGKGGPGATTLAVGLARADFAGFFKLTAVVYAAFVLSLGTYVMHLESSRSLGPQLGLLAGALFAAAVNLVTASAALSNVNGLTLVDAIHIVVLLYILVAFAVTVGGRLLVSVAVTLEEAPLLARAAQATIDLVLLPRAGGG